MQKRQLAVHIKRHLGQKVFDITNLRLITFNTCVKRSLQITSMVNGVSQVFTRTSGPEVQIFSSNSNIFRITCVKFAEQLLWSQQGRGIANIVGPVRGLSGCLE